MKTKNTDINKHISELLFLHDFVTIPNFGSFVTNYKPAEITETGILAPSKSISFNSVLKTDDGLLISYLSEILNNDYNTCKSLVSEFVKDIFTDLDNNKLVKFENIGTFEFDKKLNLIFEPKLKLNFLADSFGFSTTHFPLLEQTSTKLEKTFKDRSKLKKSLLSPTAKVLYFLIPILILISILSIKTNIFDKSNYNYSNISDIIFNDNNQDKSIIEKKLDSMTKKENALLYIEEIKPVESKIDSSFEKELKDTETTEENKENIVSENKTKIETTKKENTVVEENKETKTKGQFILVAGSFSTLKNAKRFVKKLNKKDISAEIIKHQGNYRVSAASFDSKKEAKKHVKELKKLEIKTWVSSR